MAVESPGRRCREYIGKETSSLISFSSFRDIFHGGMFVDGPFIDWTWGNDLRTEIRGSYFGKLKSGKKVYCNLKISDGVGERLIAGGRR